MAKAGFELFYAVRLRVLAHYLGQFLLVVACLNLVNAAVALLYAEYGIAASYATVIGALAGAGLLMARIRPRGHLQLNEAMVVAALVFLVVPLLTLLPLKVSGTPFIDALFETVSAVTTTGLSTLGPIGERPRTFAFARAWMQWYGGLGVVVLSLALVVRPGHSALRLAMIESEDDDLAGGTRAYAKRILFVYLGLTGLGWLLWLALGGRTVDGLLYVLAAVSTGGFAPSGGSFADLPDLRLAWAVTLACLAGAVPLGLYFSGWRRSWRSLSGSLEVWALLAAALVSTMALGVCMWFQGAAFEDVFRHAPIMALSAQTTAGFSSMDPAALDPVSRGVMVLIMATGGGIGSTAGGFKLYRLLILAIIVARSIRRMSMPANAIYSQKIDGRVLDEIDIQDALMIILAFVSVVFLSWLPFLWYGYDPLNALFDVVSATGTVGLSTGVTGSGLPAPLKLVLCADMLLGRLEFIAWMVLFYPRTWFGRPRGSA